MIREWRLMRQRNCAGGVVFAGDKVFLIQNDKGEWVLPKGVIKSGESAGEVAVVRVKYEAGVSAKILAPAGETYYEFFSVSRRAPISNKIDWFIMQADAEDYSINKDEGFQDGGFFSADEAADRITYSQDRALVRLAFEKNLVLRNS
jgi:8-oxo-dGTP pyrophosphatase MutT (NUDIX family)